MKNVVFVVVIIVAIFAIAVGVGLAFKEESKTEVQVATTPSDQQLQERYEEDVQALKDAVAEFQNADTYVTAGSIRNAFVEVEDSYNAVVASGKKVKDAKLSGLERAFNNLKESINNISGDESLQQKVSDVKSALDKFVEELKKL